MLLVCLAENISELGFINIETEYIFIAIPYQNKVNWIYLWIHEYNRNMIEVTRLNDSIFFVNPDKILFAEATPDTVITLNNGDKLVVKESPDELINRFVAFKKRIFKDGFTIAND